MKLATWNVNSLGVRLPQVLEWIAEHQPDALALQETKLTDDRFPREAFEEAGYTVRFAGQKTYNGVAVASRERAEDAVTDIPGLDDPARRILAVTIGDLRLVNLYVVNGQEVGSEKYAHKLHWLEKVGAWLEAEAAAHPRLAVVGDFNVAPEDRDVHDPAAWHERILCSTPEREALQRIMGLGLVDALRLFEQPEKTFSWWDYRMGRFRRNQGLRIDLVLLSDALASACRACYVDLAPRRLPRPSDHAPVVAEIEP